MLLIQGFSKKRSRRSEKRRLKSNKMLLQIESSYMSYHHCSNHSFRYIVGLLLWYIGPLFTSPPANELISVFFDHGIYINLFKTSFTDVLTWFFFFWDKKKGSFLTNSFLFLLQNELLVRIRPCQIIWSMQPFIKTWILER
jgi:hypothetical protein